MDDRETELLMQIKNVARHSSAGLGVWMPAAVHRPALLDEDQTGIDHLAIYVSSKLENKTSWRRVPSPPSLREERGLMGPHE